MKHNWKELFYKVAGDIEAELPGIEVRPANGFAECTLADAEFCPEDGSIRYSRKIHWQSRVIALAHEIGHLMDFFINYSGDPDTFLEDDLLTVERKAYLYGWKVVKKHELPITKDMWRHRHGSLLRKIRDRYNTYQIYLKHKEKYGDTSIQQVRTHPAWLRRG